MQLRIEIVSEMGDHVSRSAIWCLLKEILVKKIVKSISALTALACSGLILLAPISPVSAVMTSSVPANENVQGNRFEVPERNVAQPGYYDIAIWVGAGTSDLCYQLTRECTLRHGYGNGVFRQCMKRGGCG